MIAGVKNVDTVIPGHSTVMPWQDFVEFGEFTRAFLTAVQTAKKAGKTADQAAAELTLPDKFKAYVMTRAKDNVADDLQAAALMAPTPRVVAAVLARGRRPVPAAPGSAPPDQPAAGPGRRRRPTRSTRASSARTATTRRTRAAWC